MNVYVENAGELMRYIKPPQSRISRSAIHTNTARTTCNWRLSPAGAKSLLSMTGAAVHLSSGGLIRIRFTVIRELKWTQRGMTVSRGLDHPDSLRTA